MDIYNYIMKTKCSTCRNKCKGFDKKECKHYFYNWWSPKNPEICKKCMCYSDLNGNCTRHAEPCIHNKIWKNKKRKK